MTCPINNKDLMAIIQRYVQKELKKQDATEPTLINSISCGELLFQNFVFKNSAENLEAVIRFCVGYQFSISKISDLTKRSVSDISISIADALFELKFNFNFLNLLLLTKHLVDNEQRVDIPQQANDIINIKQAAIQLSMSVQTIRNRAKKGEIPVFGKSVKGYRFEKAVLLEWGRNYRNKSNG